MGRVLLLVGLLLALLVWFAATSRDPERAEASERLAPLADPEADGGVALAGPNAVELRGDSPARAPAETDGDVRAEVAAAAELGEARETEVASTYVVAIAVDHDGHPLANRELRLAKDRVEEQGAAPEPLAVARTGANGAVRFGIDEGQLVELPVSVRLQDTKGGAWAWSTDVIVPAGGVLDLGTVVLALPRELHPQVLVSGRVTSVDFAPVPGVVGTVFARRTFRDGVQVDGPTARWEGEIVIEQTGHFVVHGPPVVEHLGLRFTSPGYSQGYLSDVQPWTHGLEVILARELHLRGRLVVPEHGPPITSYCVWLTSDEGKGSGTAPSRDGEFRARGPSRSIELTVTQPASGLVLFRKVFALTPQNDGDLGTIDLRPIVKTLDTQLVDETGAALAKVAVWLEVEGATSTTGHPRGLATTTYTGRLFASVPAHALEAKLTVDGRAAVVVDLVSPPERVEVR